MTFSETARRVKNKGKKLKSFRLEMVCDREIRSLPLLCRRERGRNIYGSIFNERQQIISRAKKDLEELYQNWPHGLFEWVCKYKRKNKLYGNEE